MNDWDGVIAVEEDETVDKRRIVRDALVFEDVLPVATTKSLSEANPPSEWIKGKSTRVWRDGKLIRAEGLVDAPPGPYSASIQVVGSEKTLLRAYQNEVDGTYTITSGAIRVIVLIPVAQAVWPQASITVYDGRNPRSRDEQIRRLLDSARSRLENAQEKRFLLQPETWPPLHTHYNDVDTCEHGERLHVGWLEIAQEAENIQQLMDVVGVPDGLNQGIGDADWRVAEAVLRLMDAQERLSRIASNHTRETGVGGTVGDFCNECNWRWPCPTYRFASGTADTAEEWNL